MLLAVVRLIIMRRNQAVLAITDEQRNELSSWAQSRTLSCCFPGAFDPFVG
jgi:hypothetical protein